MATPARRGDWSRTFRDRSRRGRHAYRAASAVDGTSGLYGLRRHATNYEQSSTSHPIVAGMTAHGTLRADQGAREDRPVRSVLRRDEDRPPVGIASHGRAGEASRRGKSL